MADTNGNVAASHLATYQGVLVSIAILPDLRAAGDEFRARGYTFGILLPDGGYRSLATQEDEHAHPADHHISADMAKRLADVGKSSHGFGRAVDVFSNAPQAVIDSIMSKHGAHHPFDWDGPHWEWGNALAPADLSSILLDNSEGISMPTMMANTISAGHYRYIMTDGSHKDMTEDIPTANNWLFAFCGGDPAKIIQATAGSMQLAAFKYLDALALPSHFAPEAHADIDEAALAADLVKLLPSGGVDEAALAADIVKLLPDTVTDEELAAAVASIVAKIPTSFTATGAKA